jgi:hypothetical protein
MAEQENELILSYKEFEGVVRRFAETVPRLLLQHPVTAELALTIDKL